MQGSFWGWYLKCQSKTQTLAVIPAVHKAGGKITCSIQVITEEGVWIVPFDGTAFHRSGTTTAIGKNVFCPKGLYLSLHTPELKAEGMLRFGLLNPLKYDIMGPFVLAPFLECRHSVLSMKHQVQGRVRINGKEYSFAGDWGYWEGDRGRNFPREYLWTQCLFPGGSLMLSVAEIPIGRFSFTGMIGVVLWQGKEYRLATYLGGRAEKIGAKSVRVVQGNLELEAKLLEASHQPLQAPVEGKMIRTIHESAACRACYRFRKKGQTLFAIKTDRASFEYEYLD